MLGNGAICGRAYLIVGWFVLCNRTNIRYIAVLTKRSCEIVLRPVRWASLEALSSDSDTCCAGVSSRREGRAGAELRRRPAEVRPAALRLIGSRSRGSLDLRRCVALRNV